MTFTDANLAAANIVITFALGYVFVAGLAPIGYLTSEEVDVLKDAIIKAMGATDNGVVVNSVAVVARHGDSIFVEGLGFLDFKTAGSVVAKLCRG